ncbi:MAG: hypothetical protein ACLTDS_14740 [Bianqueaceae bacterium]
MNKIKKQRPLFVRSAFCVPSPGQLRRLMPKRIMAIDSMCRKREEAMTGTGPTKTHGAAFKRQLLR